ncbi:MAG TPA: hypothetical protein EYP30_05270 [Archaeoglobaceae archaeon]|nr:hypothetical protein [Archaeoglobaceae archaeon]
MRDEAMFEKILFPTDFSEVSLHSLYECVPELFRMGVRKLTVLHVANFLLVTLLRRVLKKNLKE